MLLDFPTKEILYSIINKSYKYIWCVNYAADTNVWNNRMTSLYGIEIQDVLTRNLKMEYLMKTEDFLEIIPFLNGSPHLLQINAIPPYYLDLNKLPDHTKYKLLKDENNFLFETDLPASPDYTEIKSPDKVFLERLINSINNKV